MLNLEKKDPFEDNMLFNSGDYEVTMDMGKLIDDDKDGIQFRGMVSLNDLYSNFSITQSIFDPYMTLTIHITNSKLVLERFGTKGLQGEEFVKIKFQTPTMHIIEDLFYVSGYGPIKQDSHNLQTGLVLRCVSKDKLINDQMTVNQTFSGSTSDIAKNIFNNYILGSEKYKQMKASGTLWKEKPIEIDESIGTQNLIIPGITPFAALHFLAVRSFGGSKYPSSFYTFYESTTAFHFKNIEKWEDDVRVQGYTYDSELGALPHHHKDFYYNIKYMSPLVMKNTMEGIHEGEYAAKTTAIDFNKKSFYVNEFNLKKERESFNILGKEFNMSSSFFDMYGNDPVEEMVVVDSTKGVFNENFASIVGRRNAYMQMLGHYNLNIVINGDSSMTAGSVIKIKLKESGAPEKKTKGSMYSGNWYVTEVAHICDNGVFNTKLTISKDGLDFTHGEGNK
jgi:hypothetical protein